MDILDKLVKKLGDSGSSMDTAILYNRQDFLHCQEAVLGIISIFRRKFYQHPVSSVKRCCDILVTVLDHIYQSPAIIEHTGSRYSCNIYNLYQSPFVIEHTGSRYSCNIYNLFQSPFVIEHTCIRYSCNIYNLYQFPFVIVHTGSRYSCNI